MIQYNPIYKQSHRRKCKICNSPELAFIDYLHYYEGLSYRKLLARFSWLNFMNCEAHFGRAPQNIRDFWEQLKSESETMSNDEILNRINEFYYAPQEADTLPDFEESFLS
ncbi:MAG TPA: hypothetical protein VK487_06255 [Candidatus Bathyarchaeia archaeon]|nr:hypothetical protein [Candidatus Bathyarchaeia archaeon]